MRDVENCPFCFRISRGRFDEKWGTGRGRVVRFEPLNPVTEGHMLFVPERHVAHAGEDPHLYAVVGHCVSRYAKRTPDSFNIITSAGAEATQSILHLHVHYVPRRASDGLHLPWTGQRK